MEEEILGEQPADEQIPQEDNEENLQEQVIAGKKEVDNGKSNGSLGKFKDAESLLGAYNNLQAEFTKKCQSLSELRSKIENDSQKNETPIYQRPEWTQKVSAFLQKNKQAQPFVKQIAQIIMQDGELAKNDSALEIAFAKVASSSFIPPDKMVQDDKFVNDYILNNEKIKNSVLDLYFKELKSQKKPQVMGEKVGSLGVLSGTPKASTLLEAKNIVKQMFD